MKKLILSIITALFLIDCSAPKKPVDETADCGKIKKTVDKFSHEVKYITPFKLIQFRKIFNGKNFEWEIDIQCVANTAYSGKGINILFKDGYRLEFPYADVSYYDYTQAGYVFLAFTYLSNAEYEKFCNIEITDYKLFIYETSVDPKQAKIYKDYANCLVSIKE